MRFNEMRGVVNECINYPHRARNLINRIMNLLEEKELDNISKFLLFIRENRYFLPIKEISQIFSRLEYIIRYSTDALSLFYTSNWFYSRLDYLSRFKSDNEELISIINNFSKEFQLETLLKDFQFNNDLFKNIDKESEFHSKDFIDGQLNIGIFHFQNLLIRHNDRLSVLLLLSIISSLLSNDNVNLEDLKLDLDTTFRIIDFKLLIK